jgi:hypothetical protein
MKNGRRPDADRILGDLNQARRSIAADSCPVCAVLAVLALMLFLPAAIAAKKKPPVTRSISGEVMDSSSNGVDGATVELTDLRTKRTLASYTLNGGHYSFDGLDPHHDYQVRAKFQNKLSRVRTVSSVSPFNSVVINLTLAPAKQ